MESNDTLENKPARETVRIYDYDVADRSDEADLVDLWIFFWKRKSLFLSSVILVTVVGIACFEMLYVPKRISTVRSLVEIKEISVASLAATNAFSVALARRMTFADLPRFASEEQFGAIIPYVMSSSINAIPGTNFIEIVTNAPANAVMDVSRFHDRITGQIVSELKSSPHALNSAMHEQFASIDDGLNRLRYLISALDRGLRKDEHSQSSSSQSIPENVNARLDNMMVSIDELSAHFAVLESTLLQVNPRVVIASSVSENISGVKKSTAYSVIIVLAVFLAIFIVVGGAFAARVKERMAGRG
jgi:hypothetical protein